MSFWYLQFPQKMNKKQFDFRYDRSKVFFFIRFLGELKTPQRHFEINWPLEYNEWKKVFLSNENSDQRKLKKNPTHFSGKRIWIIIDAHQRFILQFTLIRGNFENMCWYLFWGHWDPRKLMDQKLANCLVFGSEKNVVIGF